MPPVRNKAQAAQEVLDILHEISVLLNTGLDRATLCICVSLIENGVNPDALAVGASNRVAVWMVAKASIEQTVVRELRKRGPQSSQLESGSE